MAVVQKITIDCDFSEHSFASAVGLLGALPALVTVYCPANCAAEAQQVKDKYRCNVVLLPEPLLTTRDAWAVGCDRDFVWTPGA